MSHKGSLLTGFLRNWCCRPRTLIAAIRRQLKLCWQAKGLYQGTKLLFFCE